MYGHMTTPDNASLLPQLWSCIIFMLVRTTFTSPTFRVGSLRWLLQPCLGLSPLVLMPCVCPKGVLTKVGMRLTSFTSTIYQMGFSGRLFGSYLGLSESKAVLSGYAFLTTSHIPTTPGCTTPHQSSLVPLRDVPWAMYNSGAYHLGAWHVLSMDVINVSSFESNAQGTIKAPALC